MQEAEASDSLIGQTLSDKYRIVRQIGRGGMGVVYEAEHIALGKRVAIKLMLEKYAEDNEAIARFKREALSASRIGNPHIIDISDIGTAPDGRSFVVMELLIGSSLKDLLERTGPMSPARAISIMRQVLRAVGAAHAKNIIHRDLKPDNIFLVQQDDHHDFVKLLDFGISKMLDQAAEIAATRLTTTGTVIGTPLYMAPEQAMGEPTDQRADIYALGVILYEMLAGKPPFDGATYPILIAKLLTADPELLSVARPGLPHTIVSAVHRALEKDPERRFASCEAFNAALPGDREPSGIGIDQTMNSGSIAAVGPLHRSTKKTVPTNTRSHLPLVLGVLGGGLAIGAVAFFLLRDPKPTATAQPGPTVVPIEVEPASINVVSNQQAPAARAPGEGAPPSESEAAATTGSGVRPAVLATAPPKPTRTVPHIAASKTPPKPTVAAQEVPPPATIGTGSGGAPPSIVTARSGGATTEDVSAAIKRHDGKGCRAALAALTSPPSTDFRVASLHAVCEMVAGNCEGGTREQRALYAREGSPPDSATIIADIYCPVGNVPDVRLRRISKQISMFSNFDCNYYLGPTRDSAKVAQSARDRQIVGSLLAQIATCFSRRDQCDVARKVLGEAQVFIPALALNELKASCR